MIILNRYVIQKTLNVFLFILDPLSQHVYNLVVEETDRVLNVD